MYHNDRMMDFDIGNILYIVITLVVVIVGLLGKKKKPAEGDSETPQGKAQPGFMESLERVFTMGQEQPEVQNLQDSEEDLQAEGEVVEVVEVEEVVEVAATEEAYETMRSRPGIMEDYERLMNRPGDGELDLLEEAIMDEAMELIELDEISGTNYFDIVQNFDAGTAVVYSSIINRLDY